MDRRTLTPQTRLNQRGSKLTRQQVTILAVVGMLNVLLIALGIIAWRLMQAPETAAQNLPPGDSQPLPVWTPMSEQTAQAPLLNPAASLPPECDTLAREVQQGTVTRVIDRATLEVDVNGELVLASFAGIQPLQGEPVLAVIQGMAEGQPVTLVKDATEQDESGRLVRYIFTGGRFLNYELVRLGLARTQPDSLDRACAGLFQQAEQQARSEGIGVWKPVVVPTATFIPFVTLDPGSESGCDCSIRYECSDFSTHDAAQACYNLCNDYNSKLDEDRDGLACENFP